MDEPTVLLMSMPFGPLYQPSIGLSLLKASLAPFEIPTQIIYFTLPFADLIGQELYTKLADGYPAITALTGEWFFAEAAFGAEAIAADRYVEDVLRVQLLNQHAQESVPETFIADVLAARTHVEHFLDECLAQILDQHPQIVGFTSVFQQQVASLALAKRVKAAAPETTIVFGGANCEGAMGAEIIRQFPFVDVVVSGEGEPVFAELVQRVCRKRSLVGIQGVYTQEEGSPLLLNGACRNTPSVRDMDTLPIPDYADYFAQYEQAHFEKVHQPRLLFETSRGCWWGQKNHCTFCGLNGGTMTFRSKSAQRALDELSALTAKYPHSGVSVVDNIMDMEYFKAFIPELAARDLGVTLFYEVKANLKKEQLCLMRDAGITQIQPGIESLSDHVLRLMHKGISALQNIQLLKWCKEFGIKPHWNLLYGFPGESPEEYQRMTELIPLLAHFQPPSLPGMIRLDRFSPNFDQAEALGFTAITPYPSYFHIYPLDPQAIANLAYFFTFQYREAQEVTRYTQPLDTAVRDWQKTFETSDLFSVDKDGHLLIWDLRPAARQSLLILEDVQRALYLLCDRASSLRQLQQLLREQTDEVYTLQEIEALLHPLVERGLMVHANNVFLSLAVPLGSYAPKKPVLERLLELAEAQGSASDQEIVIPIAPTARQELVLV